MNRRGFLLGAPALVLGSGMIRGFWTSPLLTDPSRFPVQSWHVGGSNIVEFYDREGRRVPSEIARHMFHRGVASARDVVNWQMDRPAPDRLDINPLIWLPT